MVAATGTALLPVGGEATVRLFDPNKSDLSEVTRTTKHPDRNVWKKTEESVTANARLVSSEFSEDFSGSVVLSGVEVNFGAARIQTKGVEMPPTGATTDIAEKLHTAIPQLIVNIDDDDNLRKIAAIEAADGTGEIPDLASGLLLPRFTEAYDEVMDDHKAFGRIERGADRFRIVFEDSNGDECESNDLSTGEKQIIYRLGFIVKNLKALGDGIVLLDEPELGLHPRWQQKFMLVLKRLFRGTNMQVIIATHSPYIFKDFDHGSEECLFMDRHHEVAEKVDLRVGGAAHAPSSALVSFKAFGIPTPELHYDLFARLQVRAQKPQIAGFDSWLVAEGLAQTDRSVAQNGTVTDANGRIFSADETDPVWIRNAYSHPDITGRCKPTDADLTRSIDAMLRLLA